MFPIHDWIATGWTNWHLGWYLTLLLAVQETTIHARHWLRQLQMSCSGSCFDCFVSEDILCANVLVLHMPYSGLLTSVVEDPSS